MSLDLNSAALAAAQVGAQDRSANIYGSFWLDETEFAIPVSVIREVVNEPSAISRVPLSPDYMTGLFNLRGAIAPIIDLRKMLDFPAPETTGHRKIAIIEHGDLCIGLMFDSTGDVLFENSAARVDFQRRGDTLKDVVIEGVLKFEGGDRMVQVLDPHELLNLDKIPRTEISMDERKPVNTLGKRLNCISFQLGHTSCAIDLRFVQEVREMTSLDKSLLAHGYILGTTNLRGKTVPVVDFRSFVGNEPAFLPGPEALKQRKMLVMKSKGGLIGLMVFSIDSIIPYFENEVLPFAKLALPRSDIVQGCLVHAAEQIVMLLDHERLMDDPSLVEAAKSCREVHEADDVEKAKQAAGGCGERRTFILFSFTKQYALDTREVSEVINRPTDLLEPPYALSFVEGIINLRNELITLINPRRLYGLPDETRDSQKVIIFRHGDQKYAFLVDSVDEIVMTTSDKVAALKPMDYRDTMRSISEDVRGCLQFDMDDTDRGTVMILDAAALVARCVQTPEPSERDEQAQNASSAPAKKSIESLAALTKELQQTAEAKQALERAVETETALRQKAGPSPDAGPQTTAAPHSLAAQGALPTAKDQEPKAGA